MSAENTRKRISAALDLIDEAADPLRVRFVSAYATGYIDALHDEKKISVDGAQIYREDIFERRRARLAEWGIELDPEDE
ncbi:hypothetical protein [Pseudomonas gingeri]|uniref:hypothetical protein n=1 Tax=Pseudomonas gingeri TaxID=117681 RepID=UPI0015A216BD|nr:hypothetical protein [Pseudomonas gingeri]NWA11976.1 hypothetical protein [Pseudomonas gingeri]